MVMCMPGKDDYMLMQVCHCIPLLNCMENIIEKVIAELLLQEARSGELLSDAHFGRIQGQSASDAASIMVDRAHEGWYTGHIQGVLFMDIKGVFPNMPKGRLVNVIKVRTVDRNIIRWTGSGL
jgi:hypothetical protein